MKRAKLMKSGTLAALYDLLTAKKKEIKAFNQKLNNAKELHLDDLIGEVEKQLSNANEAKRFYGECIDWVKVNSITC